MAYPAVGQPGTCPSAPVSGCPASRFPRPLARGACLAGKLASAPRDEGPS